MQYRNIDKEALKNNNARVYSKITVIDTGDVFAENDHISNWTYEDFRYVPDTGFIGQFVERILDGTLMDIPVDTNLDGKRIKLELGIKTASGMDVEYYDYGNFIITESSYSDTEGKLTFKSADYTKLFNETYKDTIQYPCTALQLADNICEQIGVQLNSTGTAYTYCIKEPTVEGTTVTSNNLPVGNYNILINDEYYNFSTTEELKPHDAIILIKDENGTSLLIKTVRLNDDNEYEITREETDYETGEEGIGTTLETKISSYVDFTNNDYVIFGNYFDSDVTYREVMKSIAQLAYNWVRIDENNKVCMDFEVKETTDVDDFNKLTTDEYYTSKTVNSTIKPINKIGIGLSSVEGETIIALSDDYTVDTESSLYIYDNPLTYTETLRRIAINGCERLYGLTYSSIEINTIGHPWLEGDDLLKLTNVDNTVLYIYPFNRKIEYAGYLDETIASETMSSSEQKYEYQSSQIDRIKKTQLVVDKMNNKITSLVSDYNDVSGRVSSVEQDVEKIQSVFEIQGGINLIKNSAFLLTDEVWEFESLDDDNSFHTELGKSYESVDVTSHSQIVLRNVKVTSKLDLNNVIIGVPNDKHTFSYSYMVDANTTATVKLIGIKQDNTEITLVEKTYNTSTNNSRKSETIKEITPGVTKIRVEISTTTENSGNFYLYDLMLNVGDKQKWSPASDEIIATCIRLSQLGITIYAKGSDFATVMSANEFAIYKASYDGETAYLRDKISNFDTTGIQTTDIEADSVSTGNYIMEETKWGSYEHHVEYFKEVR